jgi:hypothetical protein
VSVSKKRGKLSLSRLLPFPSSFQHTLLVVLGSLDVPLLDVLPLALSQLLAKAVYTV